MQRSNHSQSAIGNCVSRVYLCERNAIFKHFRIVFNQPLKFNKRFHICLCHEATMWTNVRVKNCTCTYIWPKSKKKIETEKIFIYYQIYSITFCILKLSLLCGSIRCANAREWMRKREREGEITVKTDADNERNTFNGWDKFQCLFELKWTNQTNDELTTFNRQKLIKTNVLRNVISFYFIYFFDRVFEADSVSSVSLCMCARPFWSLFVYNWNMLRWVRQTATINECFMSVFMRVRYGTPVTIAKCERSNDGYSDTSEKSAIYMRLTLCRHGTKKPTTQKHFRLTKYVCVQTTKDQRKKYNNIFILHSWR